MPITVTEINKFAFEGNLEDLLVALIEQGFTDGKNSIDELVDPEDSNRGPLHFAVLGKRAGVVRVLLEKFNSSPFITDEVRMKLLNFHVFILFCFRMDGIHFISLLQLAIPRSLNF